MPSRKGRPNKRTIQVAERVAALGVDPIEVLALMVKGDWKKLGYSKRERLVGYSAKSEYPIYEDHITPVLRQKAASDLAEFLYPKRKAIELDTGDLGDQPIKLTISFGPEDNAGSNTGATGANQTPAKDLAKS